MRAEPRPADCFVEVDNREQRPYTLEPLTVVPGTLATGDYRLRDLPGEIIIERKSLEDLLGCIGNERERFERELDRMRAFPARIVIVEASWSDLERGEWRSKVTPSAAVASVLGWIASGVSFVLAGDRARSEKYAAKMLFIAFRRRYRELRAILGSGVEQPEHEGANA